MKNIQIVLNAILTKNVFEYLLIDKALKVVHISLGSVQFLETIPKEGESVIEYLPELVGLEEDIAKVFEAKEISLSLKTVNKGDFYFNIYVDHYDSEKALILLQNITEITKAQQKVLQYSNQTLLLYETLQKIIDGQNTLIFVTDNQDKIAFANKKFLEYFRLDSSNHHKEYNFKFYKIVSETLQSYEELYRMVRSKEKHITINQDTFMIDVVQIDATHRLFTLTVVTDMYEEKKNLETEVEYDALTGLIRKKYFDQKLHKLFGDHNSFALVVVDIDNFKNINDTFGHQIGDEVLRIFATLLKENLRNKDIIARWGGEEFLFVIQIESINTAIERVEMIRKVIASYPFKMVEGITASFGIAWREEEDDPDTLLRRADKALYLAKQSGKNQVVFKKREKSNK